MYKDRTIQIVLFSDKDKNREGQSVHFVRDGFDFHCPCMSVVFQYFIFAVLACPKDNVSKE